MFETLMVIRYALLTCWLGWSISKAFHLFTRSYHCYILIAQRQVKIYEARNYKASLCYNGLVILITLHNEMLVPVRTSPGEGEGGYSYI